MFKLRVPGVAGKNSYEWINEEVAALAGGCAVGGWGQREGGWGVGGFLPTNRAGSQRNAESGLYA